MNKGLSAQTPTSDTMEFFANARAQLKSGDVSTKKRILREVRNRIEEDDEKMEEVSQMGIRAGFLSELCESTNGNDHPQISAMCSSLLSLIVSCAQLPRRVRPSDVIPSLLALSTNDDATLSVPATRAVGCVVRFSHLLCFVVCCSECCAEGV
ncbi:hypothetical protein BLNAU_11993 [Blattamonas nauphoetae]|uniref:WAPL domain-containing protein n=1 Tax=Blattamonas nauphoetae TaxID=2049346 RepID=A0ABQ9XQC2_9EUKA|nr:hypothetical protein BLNAU_11993 [Blattamonas nauphoetae]